MVGEGAAAGRFGDHTLWVFFGLAFGLTWGLAAVLVLFPGHVEALFGPVRYTNPLFVLAVYSPAVAAVGLVGWKAGARGLGRFFRRLLWWRMPWHGWAVLLVGMPVAVYCGAVLAGTAGRAPPFSPWYTALPALATALVIGPVEELGWRGLALPLLQRRLAPLAAGLALGVIWALWHLPAFALSGTPQSDWSFASFFVGVVALSVIMTALFNMARGSVLVPALAHFQANNPLWPDAQPWDALGYALLAAVVVVVNRASMLRRHSGVTDVLAPRASS